MEDKESTRPCEETEGQTEDGRSQRQVNFRSRTGQVLGNQTVLQKSRDLDGQMNW